MRTLYSWSLLMIGTILTTISYNSMSMERPSRSSKLTMNSLDPLKQKLREDSTLTEYLDELQTLENTMNDNATRIYAKMDEYRDALLPGKTNVHKHTQESGLFGNDIEMLKQEYKEALHPTKKHIKTNEVLSQTQSLKNIILNHKAKIVAQELELKRLEDEITKVLADQDSQNTLLASVKSTASAKSTCRRSARAAWKHEQNNAASFILRNGLSLLAKRLHFNLEKKIIAYNDSRLLSINKQEALHIAIDVAIECLYPCTRMFFSISPEARSWKNLWPFVHDKIIHDTRDAFLFRLLSSKINIVVRPFIEKIMKAAADKAPFAKTYIHNEIVLELTSDRISQGITEIISALVKEYIIG